MKKLLFTAVLVPLFFVFTTPVFAASDLEDKTNNNDLTSNNNTVYSTDTSISQSESSYVIDSANEDYLFVPDSSSLSFTGNSTIEMWVKFDSLPSSNTAMSLVSKWHTTNSNASYRVILYNDGGTYKLQTDMSKNGLATTGNVDTIRWNWTPSTNTWYHVAIVTNIANTASSESEFFLNGSSQGNGSVLNDGSVNSIYDGNFVFEVGRTEGGGAYLDGKVDDVRIWNVARTGTQINDNKNIELSGTDSGLVAYYPFETLESLDLTDKTSNANNLTNSNATSSNETPFAASTKGISLVSSSSQYLKAADSPSLSVSNNLTLEGWVKFSTLPSNPGFVAIFGKWDNMNGNLRSYNLMYDNNGISAGNGLLFYISDDGSGGAHESGVKVSWTPSTGTWYHVAVAKNGTSVKFYVNGSQQGTTQTLPFSTINDSTAPFQIGVKDDNYAHNPFDGKVDEVRVWNVERTQTEINNNKSVELSGSESGLVAYYPFETLLIPPVVSSVTSTTYLLEVNQTATISASFSDLNTSETHTAQIDWGDTSTTSGTVSESGGSGTVSGSHTYTTAGIYTITVTVTDNNSQSGQNTSSAVVVFDPTSNHVAGNGTIYSPAGAFADEPTFTGTARFSFQFKYNGNPPSPTGNTMFRLHAANMRFDSTSYNSLTVNGTWAQYSGTGEVNNVSGYSFMVTMDDLNPDKFRMKIWNTGSGAVKYDNQWGDTNNATLTQTIDSGDIKVN